MSSIACGPAAAACAVGASLGYDAVDSAIAGKEKGLLRLGGSDTGLSENVDLILGEALSAAGIIYTFDLSIVTKAPFMGT